MLDLRKNCQKYLALFLLSIFLIAGITPVRSQVSANTPRQLVRQAEANYRAGELVSAVNYLERAVKIFKSRKDWQNLAITSTNLGRLQLNLGKAELALSSWQQATEISQQLNDESAIVRNRIYQAEAQQELGLYDRACDSLQSALGLDSNSCTNLTTQTLENRINLVSPLQITGWRSFGNVLRLLGKLDESELVLQTIAQNSSDNRPAATRISLGNTLRTKGNIIRDRQASPQYDYLPWRCDAIESNSRNIPPKAQDFYRQAQQEYFQAIALSSSENSRISAQLNLLDLILEGAYGNRPQQALADNLVTQIDTANLPINKATIYAEINLAKDRACLAQLQNTPPDWQQIEQILIKAQQNARAVANHTLESYVLGNLGGFYEYAAWWLDTRDNINSLDLLHKSNKPWLRLGERLKVKGKRHKKYSLTPYPFPLSLTSARSLLQICSTAQDCRDRAIAFTANALLLAQPDKSPQIAYQWQWQLGRLWANQKDRERAIASYQQASQTLKSIRNDLINLNSDVQFSFRDRVEPLYRQLIDLLLVADNDSPTNSENSILQALKVIDFLRLSELENFLQCSLAPELQVETVVGEIDPQAAFIYPLILADRLEIIYKLPQQPLAHRAVAIDSRKIEETVSKLQNYLRQSRFTEEVKQEAQKVYQWIIQPIEADLEPLRQSNKINTLVFVLDDTLRDIPLSILYNQGKYLIEDYALAVIPNRQLFDSRPRKPQINVLMAGVSEAQTVDGREFSPLPYVSEELIDIKKLTNTSTKPLLDQNFTEQKLEQQIDSAAFPIVHIATHGEFNSDPNETYILVWGKRIKIRDFDRLLKIDNPHNSQAIELLILSACETAQGDRRSALGLAGIAAQARVRTTLASLWKVNDRATAEFMVEFYKNLQDGTTIAQALRLTQLHFIEDPDLRRPYYWSAFVIVGNWL